MIIHVVIPDGQDDFVWPSKGSLNVLEKIKADFNTSSKPTVDRVAQVLSEGWHGGQHRAPNAKSKGSQEPSHQDSIRAWEDVVYKLKSLILSSFDLRVRQYEVDIKQRVSQRSLPGWNFCTFFVLKEGLALGFESVGLLEDALMGYDELSVELISASREEASKNLAGEDASLLREHTKELFEYARSASSVSDGDSSSSASPPTSLLEMDASPFRERILANDVSAFEFRSYVFARQVHIMLRMAASAEPDHTQSKPGESLLNPMMLAEICGRSVSFIASVSRTVRWDLESSLGSGTTSKQPILPNARTIVENVVASWISVSALEVLRKTESIFQAPVEDTGDLINPHQESDKDVGIGHPAHSVANSSTATEQRIEISRLLSENFSHHELFYGDQGATQERDARLSGGAFSSLLAQRAQLFLLVRRALCSVGGRFGWETGWSVKYARGVLENVPLDDESEKVRSDASSKSEQQTSPSQGVYGKFMAQNTASKEAFYAVYEVTILTVVVALCSYDIGSIAVSLEMFPTCWPQTICAVRSFRYRVGPLVSSLSDPSMPVC